jgi:hypothetical protein
MYSLPNPSESERPFFPLEEPVLRALGRRGGGARNGKERNWFLCFAPGTARHWPRRSQDPKARYCWPWSVGTGVVCTVGGRDGDWEWKGGGWCIFYRRPVLTSITLAFFKSMCSAQSPQFNQDTIRADRYWVFLIKRGTPIPPFPTQYQQEEKTTPSHKRNTTKRIRGIDIKVL